MMSDDLFSASQLVLHCRPGFENECAAEITERAATLGVYGYVRAKAGTALVYFVPQQPEHCQQLIQQLDFSELIFARQWFCGSDEITADINDRVSPLLALAEQLPRVDGVVVETADTNSAKELLGFCKKFQPALLRGLEKGGRLSRKNKPGGWRLHCLVNGTDRLVLGVAPVTNSAAWLMGIPRLRLAKDAPSRSALKLEEAWHHFIPAAEWEQRLAAGQKAVDLGAAPGGWTWQLVRKSFFVQAVDNGPMNDELMESGQVQHVRADGFTYEPPKPVQWMVCDIVDKPSRVAAMVSHWFKQGWCQEVVFNLKLPMKQRYRAVMDCQEQIQQELAQQRRPFSLRFKQLYHDREEVTGHLYWLR